MLQNGKVPVIFQMILLLVFLFTSLMVVSFVTKVVISLLLITIILIIGWRQADAYDDLLQRNKQLIAEKDILEESNLYLEEKSNDYELLFNSLDGAVFSIDKLKNRAHFSKGAEQIFCYSAEELNNNPALYKEMIHRDDLAKVELEEVELLLGNISEVEFRIILPDGREKWIKRIANPILNEEGVLYKINGKITDITKRIRLEHNLKQLAYHDALTDLPNRKALDLHIEKALARSKRHEHNFTLMFIDLDDFKKVNDTMGHDAGDILLKEVVNRLNVCIREEDLISRIGGDEFIIVFEETHKDVIEDIAKRILETVALPYEINEQEAKISLSIGVSMYPDDGVNKETLIDHADKAMYFAKHNGKNNYKIYSHDLQNMEFKKGLLEKWVMAIQNSKIFNKI